MKQVTVYTLSKKQAVSYGDTIPTYTTDFRDIDYQAGEYFSNQSIKEVHLPIHRFCWYGGKEIFAAFDEEVLELIGCLQDQKDDEIMQAKIKIARACLKTSKLEVEGEMLKMTFWERVKFMFTGKLEK